MSAPVIWILFPLIISAGMLGFLQRTRLLKLVGLLLSGLLSILALLQPIGNVLQLGPISIDIVPELTIFGRVLLLENSDRFTLCLIYTTLAFFIGGIGAADQESKFIPLSMAISAILTAALSVQPFLYSAVLVELAVLLMILLVTVKGKYPEKGIIRFLIYLSLAMPIILFAGWILGGAQANPSDVIWQSMAALFLGIGFALWLAVFPFHSWIPQFAQSVHPYSASFIFCLLPVVTLLIMLDYVSGLIWLREGSYLSPVIKSVGIIMIVTSGIWVAVEKDLKRILAFTVLYETGFALLLVSQQSTESVSLLYQAFVPRILALSLLGMSLSILQKTSFELSIQGIKSTIKRYPIVMISILLSLFSIAGLPLFAGFPIKFETLKLIGSTSTGLVVWALIGMFGFVISIVRIFASTTLPASDERMEIHETATQFVFLAIGCFVLLILGWFPGIVKSLISSLIINLPVLQ